MDTFTIVRKALDDSASDPMTTALERGGIAETARITLAVQAVVDTLTPPDGGRYIVGFVDIATAGTDLAGRRIVVSSKPLHDPALSLIEKAVVIATFAAHEIGHTLVTRPRAALIREHNPHSGFHAVANLADDIILEPFMADRFPILRDAFAFTGLWVLRNTAKELPKREHGNWDTTPQRFNTLLSATRYADIPEIVWATKRARIERDWGRDWARRLIAAKVTDHATFLALCDEAWERIRTREPEPEPEPEPLGQTPEGTNESESDAEPEQGEDEGEGGEGDDESEPGEPPEDEGQGDDEGDEGDDVTDGDDEPTDADGDGDGDEGESDDEGDESDESDATDDGDEAEGSDGESEDEPEGDGDHDATDDAATDGDGEGDDDADDWDQDGGEDWDDADGEDDDEPVEGSDDEYADGGDHDSDRDGGGGNAEQGDPGQRDEDDWDDSEVDTTTHQQSEEQDPAGEQVEQAVRTFTSSTQIAFGKHGTALVTWD